MTALLTDISGVFAVLTGVDRFKKIRREAGFG